MYCENCGYPLDCFEGEWYCPPCAYFGTGDRAAADDTGWGRQEPAGAGGPLDNGPPADECPW
jgi:hypothetical protein